MRRILLGLTVGCFYASASIGAVPVELWTGGDDGLTQRFADSVRTAISESRDFSEAPANKGALVVRIPTHVYWSEVRGKINFSVVVIMTDSHSKYLGVSTGSCWEEEMKSCAERVVADARNIWAVRNGR
jgi:hypothetical protein